MIALILAMALAFPPASASTVSCPVGVGKHVILSPHLGQRVVLFSSDFNSVIVWKRRGMLEGFLRGQWNTVSMMARTYAVINGTRAIVVTACPAGNPDIVGVRVLSGEFARNYGWAQISDVKF